MRNSFLIWQSARNGRCAIKPPSASDLELQANANSCAFGAREAQMIAERQKRANVATSEIIATAMATLKEVKTNEISA